MTLRYLIDTMVISSPVSKLPDQEIIRKLRQHGEESAIAAPVWHELKFGCERLPRGKRRAGLQEYLDEVVSASFPILPYDSVAAAWHALERARLEKLGNPVPYVDGQIAAIAHTNGLILVTFNKKVFTRFKDLQIERW